MKTTLEILKNQIPNELLPQLLDNATQSQLEVYNKHIDYLLKYALDNPKSPFLRNILFQIVQFDVETIPDGIVSLPGMIISKDIVDKYLLKFNDEELNNLWKNNSSLNKVLSRSKEFGLFD